MVEEVVRRGEILYWQDVADWVTAERAKLGMEELQGEYPRKIARAISASIEEFATSRLPPSNQLANKGGSLKSILEEVEKDTEDADARMSVVRAAGTIVRADVESDPALNNTSGTREKHRYADKLDMKVKPPRETLLTAFPPALVGFYQSMTNMALYREIIASETEHPGEPWVWHTEGRDGRHPTNSGVLEGANVDGEKKDERPSILESPGCGIPKGETDGTLPTRASWRARTLMEKRRTRLLVMCTVVVKSIWRGRRMGSHDIKGAQWAKSKAGDLLRWKTSLWGRSGTGRTEHGGITSFRPNSTAAYSLRRGTTPTGLPAADTYFESKLR
ncbi:unnamed protein product [Ectocarpus sp. CCAP 1310/34]|nr:unnamed protein product [Ectocarpus sp. CCAP 1310/34]